MQIKRALVLSGGGLFGAWQVGAWSVLRHHFKPDVIVGASIGSLNGWALAGGAEPEELAQRWREAASRAPIRFRLPLNPLDGVVEFTTVEAFIRELHAAYRPRCEYHLVMTDLFRMRPRMVDGAEVQWRHLAASCALLGFLPQQKIGKCIYTDGGLLGALPIWAAKACGATEILGLNVMPRMPWPIRAALQPMRKVRRLDGEPSGVKILKPSVELGTWKQALLWHHARLDEWIEQGKRDGEAFLSN